MLRNIYHRYGMWQHLKNRMRKKLHMFIKNDQFEILQKICNQVVL